MHMTLLRLVAIWVTSTLLIFLSSARAVIGIPDDVPGATLLYPFFKVNPGANQTSRQDTIIVITNVAYPLVNTPLGQRLTDITVHITIWSARSEAVYDFNVQLTPEDVYSCSLLDVLVNPSKLPAPCDVAQAPVRVLDQLQIGGNLLGGYVTADLVSEPTTLVPGQAGYPFLDWNILVGHVYLVGLQAGSFTGFNAVSIESATTDPAQTVGPFTEPLAGSQLGFYLNSCIERQGAASGVCAPAGAYGNRERIDGASGDLMHTGSAIQPALPAFSGNPDSPLSLIFRYFSLAAVNGRTEIWLWKDHRARSVTRSMGLVIQDEDENRHSVTLALDNNVNFVTTDAIVTPGAPGGWFQIKFTCGQFDHCAYDPNDPETWTSRDGVLATPIQAVAYSLQFADTQDGALRGVAVFPSHRQYTDFIGGPSTE